MLTKEFYNKIFIEASHETEVTDVEKLTKDIWFNLRNKAEGGLRITDFGLNYISTKSDIKIYQIEIPKEVKFTPQVLLWLDKFIDTPWHLHKHTISVISEKTAFELYLFSGDVRKLGQNKAMAKKFENQI
jgi:hypothetical protein